MAGCLADNYQKLLHKIDRAKHRSGRTGDEITLIAVTKGVAPEIIKEAASLGIKSFGENRVQEVLPKLELLPQGLDWHFIGHLQSNKVKYVLPRFNLIHSLDRISLAKEINKRAERQDKVIEVLVQVNIAEEESKFGLYVGEVEEFIKTIAQNFPNIKIKGLMTIAPYGKDPEDVRPVFRELRKLSRSIKVPGADLKELSMGMTNDFEVAIEEGATMIRVGTALFK